MSDADEDYLIVQRRWAKADGARDEREVCARIAERLAYETAARLADPENITQAKISAYYEVADAIRKRG